MINIGNNTIFQIFFHTSTLSLKMIPLKCYILLFFAALVLGCQSHQIVKEKFLNTIPIGNPDSSVEIFNTDFNKITYKDMVLYELPYRESFRVDGSIISDSTKYEYFIFNKTKKSGYLFKKITDSFQLQKNIDSLLTPRAYYHLTFDSILNLKNKHEIREDDKDKIKISFISQNETTDSIIANFNNELKILQYSLAPKLDSIFQSKLYKVEYWFKAKDRNGNALVATFEIRPEVIKDKEELLQLFYRFEKYLREN